MECCILLYMIKLGMIALHSTAFFNPLLPLPPPAKEGEDSHDKIDIHWIIGGRAVEAGSWIEPLLPLFSHGGDTGDLCLQRGRSFHGPGISGICQCRCSTIGTWSRHVHHCMSKSEIKVADGDDDGEKVFPLTEVSTPILAKVNDLQYWNVISYH